LSEGDRRRFVGERLSRCTVHVGDQRKIVSALVELVRRVRAQRSSTSPPTTTTGPLPRSRPASVPVRSRGETPAPAPSSNPRPHSGALPRRGEPGSSIAAAVAAATAPTAPAMSPVSAALPASHRQDDSQLLLAARGTREQSTEPQLARSSRELGSGSIRPSQL